MRPGGDSSGGRFADGKSAGPPLVRNFPAELSDRDFSLIRGMVYDMSGIYLKDGKKSLVANRLRKRVVSLGLPDYSHYCRMLRTAGADPKEVETMLNLITTNETQFFREQKHFEALSKLIFPVFASGGRRMNLWCAGCSTGQEPYSIAIAALDHMAAHGKKFPVGITAGDICSSAVEAAREGVFGNEKMKGLDSALLAKYFEKGDGGYRVAAQVRGMVTFRRMNILNDRPPLPQDVVFCRNVMIYFDVESQKKLLRNIRDSLKEGGCLIIGLSESIHSIAAGFVPERAAGAFVYRKAADASAGAHSAKG